MTAVRLSLPVRTHEPRSKVREDGPGGTCQITVWLNKFWGRDDIEEEPCFAQLAWMSSYMGYTGIMEKKMETNIILGYVGVILV